jgi:hypothetical protein
MSCAKPYSLPAAARAGVCSPHAPAQPDPEWLSLIERSKNATRGNKHKARLRLQDAVTERLRQADERIIEMKGP